MHCDGLHMGQQVVSPVRIVVRLLSLVACCTLGAFFYYWSSSHPLFGTNVGLIGLSCATFVFLNIRVKAIQTAQKWTSISLLTLAAVLFVVSAIYVVTSLIKIDYKECQNLVVDGAQVVKIWLFKSGINIYPINNNNQYLVSIYTPVYYFFAAAIDFALNNTFTSALVVNGISLAIICSTILLWAYSESRAVLAGAFAVVGYLSNPAMTISVVYVRPDLLAWAFALSGAYLFFNRKHGSRWQYAAAALLGVSVFIKQQVAAILIGCVSTWIISWASWRKSLALLLLSGAICATIFASIQYCTEGGFLTHVLLYPLAMAKNTSVSNWSNAEPRLISFATTNAGILLLTLVIIVHDVIRKKFHPLNWMILIHIPFVVRLLMHWGAADNYYWGILALMYARAGCYFGEFRTDNKRLVLQTGPLLLLLLTFTPSYSSLMSQLGASKAQNETVTMLPAVLEAGGYRNVLINSEAGSAVLKMADRVKFTFFDGFDLSFFEQAKLWKGSESQLFRDIRDRKYDAVVVGSSFVAPSFYWNLYDSYTVSASVGSAKICTPLEGKLVKFTVPTDEIILRDGLSLKLENITGSYVSAAYNAFSFTKHEASQESVLIFKIESGSTMRSIRVALAPLVKHIGGGNLITVEWSTDNSTYYPTYIYEGLPDDDKKGFLDARKEFSFAPNYHVVYLKIILNGSGQLWFSPDYPISFLVS